MITENGQVNSDDVELKFIFGHFNHAFALFVSEQTNIFPEHSPLLGYDNCTSDWYGLLLGHHPLVLDVVHEATRGLVKLLLVAIVRDLVLRQEVAARHVRLIYVWGADVYGRVEVVHGGREEGAAPVGVHDVLRGLEVESRVGLF